MFKKPKGIPKPKYNLQYNSNRDRFEVGGNESEEELSDEELMGVGGMGKNLLYTLSLAECNCFDFTGNQELKSLQKRLNETESAMQKILQQLENLTNAGQSVDSETAQSVSVLTQVAEFLYLRPEFILLPDFISFQQTLDNLSKFETYRAEKGVIPQSNGPDLLQSKSPEGTAYLQDLEKALLDFKVGVLVLFLTDAQQLN